MYSYVMILTIKFNSTKRVEDFLRERSDAKVVAEINVKGDIGRPLKDLLMSPRIVGILWYVRIGQGPVNASTNGRVPFETFDAPHVTDMRFGKIHSKDLYRAAALRCPKLKTIYISANNNYDTEVIKILPQVSAAFVVQFSDWTAPGQSKDFALKLTGALNGAPRIKHLVLAFKKGEPIFCKAKAPQLMHVRWISVWGLNQMEIQKLMQSKRLRVIEYFDDMDPLSVTASTLRKLPYVDFMGCISYRKIIRSAQNTASRSTGPPSLTFQSLPNNRAISHPSQLSIDGETSTSLHRNVRRRSPLTLQSLPHNAMLGIIKHLPPRSFAALSETAKSLHHAVRKPRVYGGLNLSQEVRLSMQNVPKRLRTQLIRGNTITVNLATDDFNPEDYRLLAKAIQSTRVEYTLIVSVNFRSIPSGDLGYRITTLNDTLFKRPNIKTLEIKAVHIVSNVLPGPFGPCPHVTTLIDKDNLLKRRVLDLAFPKLEVYTLKLDDADAALQNNVANALRQMPLNKLTITWEGPAEFKLCASLPPTLRVLVILSENVDYVNLPKLPRLNQLSCGRGATQAVAHACELGYFPVLSHLYLSGIIDSRKTLVTRKFLYSYVINLKEFRGYVRTTDARRKMRAAQFPTLTGHALLGADDTNINNNNSNSNNNSASV